ncbi:Leucine-rich repeat (LRR) family protein [Rhynchospora pubera]|uniref:Leucine-rich repeat (LRR) family protein n=1 Tax=Rhynchospora pubera TaxID=906938 RepID=A0AAV8E3H4_9POAL|nr:Leucine-rich repeat (LRR) family protein [Rhynchospora pubera]
MAGCSVTDRAALLDFKASIVRDTTGILSSWVGTDCCDGWEGVDCNPQTGRVTSLQLERPHGVMKGTLSSSLGNLKFLQVLVVSGMKQITGTIPDSLSNLVHLTQLYLEDNMLQGRIPSNLSQLRSLMALSLNGNNFTGELPPQIGFISGLTQINFGRNRLVPSEIGNLRSLNSLSLSSNLLTGIIPDSIVKLQKLWYLNLSNNAFMGLPSGVENGLPSLLSIDLSYNKFQLGIIPNWIRNREMRDVHLASCGIKGLPQAFAKPETLNSLNLSSNFLTGEINGFLTNMTNLVSLDLSKNRITGFISQFGKQMSPNLKWLDLSNNGMSGQIPSSISNLTALKRLDLSRNQIKGIIPDSMGQMASLVWLDLSHNQLIGKIPETFAGLSKLGHVNFRVNKLCGEIPQKRPFNVFKAVAYAHNLCLCGNPMPPCKRL